MTLHFDPQRSSSPAAPARALLTALVLLLLLLPASCQEDDPPRRPPPPPPPKTQPAACQGEARYSDPANVKHFPKSIGDYCIDPRGSDKGFGEGAKGPLNGICDLFDGECEIYKSYRVERVIEVRYVDGRGSSATVDVYLSKFASTEDAYGMFTKRVVGDGDPALDDAPRPIPGGGAAALGIGNAYLWRGPFLAELTYNDDQGSEDKIRTAGDKLLPTFVKALGDKLAGPVKPPAAVASLPREDLLPLGIRYITDDVLDLAGAGPGAFGYYRKDKQRWRVLAVARDDEEQAKDVFKTIKNQTGSSEEEGIGAAAVRLMLQRQGGAQAEWIVARQGKWVIGIGDEERVLRVGMTPEEHSSKVLSGDDKRKLLKTVLDTLK